MFRNYLAAALRNLARNRLYAGINIVGLAVGFAAAILIALFVRDEFSYDRWLPDHERIYRVNMIFKRPGGAPGAYLEAAFSRTARFLEQDFPEVESGTRLYAEDVSMRRGDFEATEHFYWADPTIFEVLRLPALAGNLTQALARPDEIVLTWRMARKYFGRDDPLGETIEIGREHPMIVTAILRDLPSNTHLNTEIIASNLAPFSPIAKSDAAPVEESMQTGAYTYIRLAAGASVMRLQQAMPDFVDRHIPIPKGVVVSKASAKFAYDLVPIAAIHLRPAANNDSIPQAMSPSGDRNAVTAILLVGLLIVLLAGINFVNLMTARAVRRAVEVGVRKVSGAARRDLIVQFIGEWLIYVGLGMVAAVALVELSLPAFNAFLDKTIAVDWRDPTLTGGLVGLVLLVGVAAGFYPAFVLSAFKPAAVLKGGIAQSGGSGIVRQVLVVLQFAILIGLILATGIIYRQTDYALNETLRFDKDQILWITRDDGHCNDAFADALSALPGVRAAACDMGVEGRTGGYATLPDGRQVRSEGHLVDFGYFETYGVTLLAGRFFSRDHGGDAPPPGDNNAHPLGRPVVINETAMRAYGFASVEQAIGQRIGIGNAGQPPEGFSEIIGVVPDFSLYSIREAIAPTFYNIAPPAFFGTLSVKLSGRNIPETLKMIDRLWNKMSGQPKPITRKFLDQYVQTLYLDIIRQAELFSAFAGVALFIACLGLFGLSAFTAERRTKEIGIRKAMGARRWDIVKLLVWQFLKPVLLANLIAWPVGYYFMNRWLHGFAYHVDLSPWIFLAAGASALVIALATVSVHAFIVAGARPVTALRYE